LVRTIFSYKKKASGNSNTPMSVFCEQTSFIFSYLQGIMIMQGPLGGGGGGACNIQVVRQLDTKFGCIICKHVIVYTSCTKQ
jgi:hypothetical protein